MKTAYWLLKTEPHTFSIEQLKKDEKTPWNGVRNFQARNFLKQMKADDQVLIYHSAEKSGEKGVVGLGRVIREAYPEPTNDGREWVQVDIEFVKKFTGIATLEEIKKQKKLENILLLKQSRLSVMPVTSDEACSIIKLAEK
jgi:predicted RNA-binding protein with PUA-like domain